MEKGGLHWGISLRKGLYSYFVATWPFVTLHLSPAKVRIAITSWKGDKIKDLFELETSEVRSVRRKRALITTAFVFEHDKPDYPKLLKFHSFKSKVLSSELIRRGYNLVEE